MLLKNLSFILFTISAAGFVSCGGPKKSPRTSSILQIIVSVLSFEISEGRNRGMVHPVSVEYAHCSKRISVLFYSLLLQLVSAVWRP